MTPLHASVLFQDSSAVRDLLDAGLHASLLFQANFVVRALLDAGAVVDAADARGVTPLMLASMWAAEGVYVEGDVSKLVSGKLHSPKLELLVMLHKECVAAGRAPDAQRDAAGRTWLHHLYA